DLAIDLVVVVTLLGKRGLSLRAIAGIEVDDRGTSIRAPPPRPLDLRKRKLGVGALLERLLHPLPIRQHVGPERDRAARVAPHARIASELFRAPLEEAKDDRMRFVPRDRARRVLFDRRLEPRERANPRGTRPLLERLDRDRTDSKRRQDLADV